MMAFKSEPVSIPYRICLVLFYLGGRVETAHGSQPHYSLLGRKGEHASDASFCARGYQGQPEKQKKIESIRATVVSFVMAGVQAFKVSSGNPSSAFFSRLTCLVVRGGGVVVVMVVRCQPSPLPCESSAIVGNHCPSLVSDTLACTCSGKEGEGVQEQQRQIIMRWTKYKSLGEDSRLRP